MQIIWNSDEFRIHISDNIQRWWGETSKIPVNGHQPHSTYFPPFKAQVSNKIRLY